MKRKEIQQRSNLATSTFANGLLNIAIPDPNPPVELNEEEKEI